MKRLLLLFLVALSAQVYAQDYPDLLELLIDEKYPKLLLKAEKYTLDDETRKDALPYLYMSMGYHAIAEKDDDPDLQEKYGGAAKAFKEAVKYAVKHRKKDKQNVFYEEYSEYFDELRERSISDAFGYVGSEKYTKAKGFYKNLTKLDVSDAGAWIFKACMEHKSKSTREALLSFEEAKRIMDEEGCDRLTVIQKEFLKQSIIYCAEMLDEEGNNSQAREWLELGLAQFEKDDEFMVTYEMIAG